MLRSLLVCAALLGLMPAAQAAPALWEASDGDSRVWLFGSIHLLPPGLKWRTRLFNETLAEADKVYFETDIGAEAQMEIADLAFERGFNVDGTLLSNLLDEDEIEALRTAAAQVNTPMPVLLTMKPWMAANTLSVAAATVAGFDMNTGVDLVLQTELPEEKKGYFETGAEQLEFIAGAPGDEQIEMLMATIADTDRASAMLDALLASWRAGTPEEIADIFLAELGAQNEAFMDRLIYQRNRNWMTPIEAMLADDVEALVVVGTGHLVGDGSVIDLLEEAGYTVRQVQ